MLEEECHLLGLELAQKTSPTPADHKQYQQYSSLIHELTQLEQSRSEQAGYIESLKNGITSLALHIYSSEANVMVQALQEEADSAIRKLETLVSHTCFCG